MQNHARKIPCPLGAAASKVSSRRFASVGVLHSQHMRLEEVCIQQATNRSRIRQGNYLCVLIRSTDGALEWLFTWTSNTHSTTSHVCATTSHVCAADPLQSGLLPGVFVGEVCKVQALGWLMPLLNVLKHVGQQCVCTVKNSGKT